MTDDENDLEQRKQDMWSMDEVRGSSAATSEGASDPSDTVTEDPDAEAPSQSGGTEKETSGASDADQQRSDASDIADTQDPSSTADTVDHAAGDTVRQMALDADAKNLAVRDLHNVNVYLYEEIYREMVATFKQLDSEYFQEHGDDLSKNKAFFNAVFRAGLNSPQLREELELE